MKNINHFSWVYIFIFLSFYTNVFPLNIKQVPAEDIVKYYPKRSSSGEQPYVVGVYMAARNDLFPFAGRNLRQMQMVGSSDRLKILVNFDTQKAGQKRITKRLLIEKDQIIQFGPDMSLDSGDPKSLIDFYKWQITNFPGKQIALLWNHGDGIIPPKMKHAVNPSELFVFNPHTRMISLDRTVGYIEYIEKQQNELENNKPKSICFDNTTGNFLTTQDIKTSFETLCRENLNGGKFEVILCDACLMGACEFASAVKNSANYLVASSEVVLGTGYDYNKLLYPLSQPGIDTLTFVKHVVKCFQSTYGRITHDYAHSAIDLSKFELLEENTKKLAILLIFGINNQKNDCVKDAIALSINRNFCTQFDEPTYKDYGHVMLNLFKNLNKFQLTDSRKTQQFKSDLDTTLRHGMAILKEIVIENAVGRSLKDATGLSIYFPSKNIHKSYFDCEFGRETHWIELLKTFLKPTNNRSKKN